MDKFVTPETYFIGYTTINQPELDRYLSDSGNQDFLTTIQAAREQGLTDGEILTSFYAKLCYASLTLGKNDNITRVRDISDNLKATLSAGHGSVFEHCQLNFVTRNCSRVFTHELVRHRVGTAFCLAGDSQIYCGRGKSEDGSGSWGGAKKIPISRLYEMSTDPDHRRRSRLKLVKVRCYDGEKFVMTKVRGVTQSGVKKVYRVTLEDGKTIKATLDHRFLGRDGWKRLGGFSPGDELATNGRKIIPPTKPVLKELYVDQGLTQDQLGEKFGVSGALVKKWLYQKGLKKPGAGHFKKNQEPWNLGLTGYTTWNHTEETKKRLSAAKMGEKNPAYTDGMSIKRKNARNHRKLYCEICDSTKDLHGHHIDRNHSNDSPENIRTLCNSCHGKTHQKEDGSKTLLVVRWVKIKSIELVGEEMTYDLEVYNRMHNFVANGIVTHNSQTSGRYVRGDEINVVFDPILDPVRDRAARLVAHIEREYNLMVKEMGLAEMTDFNQKKKVTSALRRFAPNGQSNEIGFSLNLRSLRHVIQVRTGRHAEWEIREVFGQVYQLVKEKYPTIFADAKEEMVNGLVEVSGMKMQPY